MRLSPPKRALPCRRVALLRSPASRSTGLPAAPREVRLTAASPTAISLHIKESRDHGGAVITRYKGAPLLTVIWLGASTPFLLLLSAQRCVFSFSSSVLWSGDADFTDPQELYIPAITTEFTLDGLTTGSPCYVRVASVTMKGPCSRTHVAFHCSLPAGDTVIQKRLRRTTHAHTPDGDIPPLLTTNPPTSLPRRHHFISAGVGPALASTPPFLIPSSWRDVIPDAPRTADIFERGLDEEEAALVRVYALAAQSPPPAPLLRPSCTSLKLSLRLPSAHSADWSRRPTAAARGRGPSPHALATASKRR